MHKRPSEIAIVVVVLSPPEPGTRRDRRTVRVGCPSPDVCRPIPKRTLSTPPHLSLPCWVSQANDPVATIVTEVPHES
uniref:Secreted protein n=1 Tax=Peronospora matthiolae TaxID=2874970 RepID=A0AAV1VH42_9STRA